MCQYGDAKNIATLQRRPAFQYIVQYCCDNVSLNTSNRTGDEGIRSSLPFDEVGGHENTTSEEIGSGTHSTFISLLDAPLRT